MTRFWVVTVMGAFGRLVAIAGAALTVGTLAGIVAEWVISALRYAPDWNVGLLPVVVPLQVAVAGWVAWSALMREPRRLLRNLLIAAALSFLLLYGWYFLLVGGGGALVGVGNLLYLLAGLTMLVAVLGDRALGSAEPGSEEMVRGAGVAVTVLGAIVFGIAAIAGYASIPSPPEAQAIAPPSEPPCPDYLDKELASLRGSGDRRSSAFETPGYWGYEYDSTGYGTLGIRILAETGDVVYGADEPPIQAGSVGGGDFALGPGTFRLDVEADEDAKYAVVACGEADPSLSDKPSPGRQSGSREQMPSAPDAPVPDVVGMNPQEACATLAQSGYRGIFAGDPVDDPVRPGSVVGQHPQPGSKDLGGRLVHLLASRSSSERPLEPPPGCVNTPG